MDTSVRLCLCVRVTLGCVCLLDVGEIDLALFGRIEPGSEPAQLPQRNRGRLFSLHTGRTVLERFSESSIHI